MMTMIVVVLNGRSISACCCYSYLLVDVDVVGDVLLLPVCFLMAKNTKKSRGWLPPKSIPFHNKQPLVLGLSAFHCFVFTQKDFSTVGYGRRTDDVMLGNQPHTAKLKTETLMKQYKLYGVLIFWKIEE